MYRITTIRVYKVYSKFKFFFSIRLPLVAFEVAMWITLLSEAHALCHLLQQINIYFYFYLTLTLAYFLHVLAQTASTQFLCHELDKNDYLLFRLGPLSFTS